MEIIDPRTKSCTFLTLKDYVGELGKVKRAQCLLEKNEAFMTSENLWIAAESFKISVSPNPNGIVYRFCPPEYYIQIEFDSATPTNKVPYDALTVRMDLIDVRTSGSENCQLGFSYDSWKAAYNIVNPGTMNSDEIMQEWLRDINSFRICKGAELESTLRDNNANLGVLTYTLDEDPLANIRGAEYGHFNDERIEMEFVSDFPPSMNTAGANPSSLYWKVSKDKHPGLTVDLLKTYISTGGRHGCYLYGMQRVPQNNNPNRVPGANLQRVPEFVVKGPSVIKCHSPIFTHDPDAQGYNAQVPLYAIYTKEGPMKTGGTVYQYHSPLGGGPVAEYHTTVETLNTDWVKTDSNGDLFVSIWCQQIAHGGNYWNNAHGIPSVGDLYHLYANSGPDLQDVAVDDNLYSNCKITPTKWNGVAIDGAHPLPANVTANVCETPEYPAQDNQNHQIYSPIFYKSDTSRTSYRMQAHETDSIATYTPSDFFQHFNIFPGDKKPPIRLGQDPNGGFRVSLLEEVKTFSMSKVMMDDLGLNTYLTLPEVTSTDTNAESHFLPEVIPLDNHNQWLRDYSASGSSKFYPKLTVGKLNNFDICDPSGVVTGPLEHDTPSGTLLLSRVDQKRYKLITMHTNLVKEEKVTDGRIEGMLNADENNNLYYSWTSPPQGAFLGNTQTVSLDSFALFSSIRIVVPDGVIFQPMLAGRSDARILAELRLVFDLGPPQVEQGFGPDASPEGLLMSTSYTNYGDLLWNSSPSKQYLQVTSGNPIYRINCEVRLIYRDPTIEPKVLYLGYNDLFELKLRLLQLQ